LGEVREFEVFARSAAPPEEVWALLVDATAWNTWTRIPRAEREREGTPAPDGVGSIRSLGPRRFASREEVVAFEPPRHFAYILLSGLPVERYRADVHLSADGEGTLITWRALLVPKWRGSGPFLERFLRSTLTSFARGLARRAAQASSGALGATSSRDC
jgi:uncharacterized protein YndB with AHSA1/START domain